jgi:ABC-type transport system involved in multi-copper enzyme maturation permease subunit
MNANMARALLRDAFYQVLDNMVFRILVLIVIVLAAPAFLVALKENEISILFGWKVISYEDLLEAFGGSTSQIPDDMGGINVAIIQNLQTLFTEWLAGFFGVIFCIAATAFFVPRMLEKGAADVLFSKPLGRLTLLLARFVSGIIFVGILATILVVGIHVGLLVRSGYSDPGFLLSIFNLVYLFAIVHSFSVCVATLTRSSVAAILMTMVFFVGTSCVHSQWVTQEHKLAQEELVLERKIAQDPENAALIEPETQSGIFVIFWKAWYALHYVLPKTNDADVLSRKLLRELEGDETALKDAEGKLAVDEHPEGFEYQPGPTEAFVVDLDSAPAVWIARDEAGAETARIELSRRTRLSGESTDGKRQRKLSAPGETNRIYKALRDQDGVLDAERARDDVDGAYAGLIRWEEETPEGRVMKARVLTSFADWFFELEISFDDSWSAEDAETAVEQHLDQYTFAPDDALYLKPRQWYERTLSFSGPLKHNIFFSIGSTIAACVFLLGIAWFRLTRIDF